MEELVRFDMMRPPVRQRLYLMPIIRLLSAAGVFAHRAKLVKTRMGEVSGPYLLLCNHNAFLDFMVTSSAIRPKRANYVVAIDGFLINEWLLRNAGCICTRKFSTDVALVRQMKRVIQNGDVAVLYPEARYSLCGTTATLPDSLGKLAKFLDVPVVTLIMHGHHINSPFWNLTDRKVKGVEAEMKLLFSRDDIKTHSVSELNEGIRNAFQYDDYAWQKEKGIKIKYKNRAKGLHKVLYQCPACKTEYRMNSGGDLIWCGECGKSWKMSELGELAATTGETEFSHIPDWYEWQRDEVRREVQEGSYYFNSEVRIQGLPNARGFVDLGKGRLVHGTEGFKLTFSYKGKDYLVERSVATMYACHIEYNYLGKHGDCIDINTPTDTFYIYPEGRDFSVTKISLATEELYIHRLSQLEKDEAAAAAGGSK